MIRGALKNLMRCETLKKQQYNAVRAIFSNKKDSVQQAPKFSDAGDNIIRSPFPDVEVPSCLLDEFVWKDLNKWGNKTAIVRFQDFRFKK
jgi:hypothetical protein